MEQMIKVYTDFESADTSLLLGQSFDIIKAEIEDASVVVKQSGTNEKSFFVTAILIPVVVGVSTTLICDAVKAVFKRITKEKKEPIKVTIEDANGKKTVITLGEENND